MGCYNDGYPPTEKELLDAKAPAMLCAVMSRCEALFKSTLPNFINSLDYPQAGVTSDDLTAWWKEHKARDALRLAREANARVNAKKHAEALAKLTAEDRETLGL